MMQYEDTTVAEPDAQAEIRYAVELGTDYEPCLHPVRFAAPAPTESAPPIAGPQPAQVIVHASMLESDLQIDALFDEWEPFEYISDLPVFGPENWFGPEDGAAEWSLFWNAEHLFIGVRVADDAFAQRATGSDISKGDGLEVLLDAHLSRDATLDERNDDDYQLGISPGDLFDPNGRPEAYMWWPEEREGAIQLPMAYRREENESDWVGEIAIPWSLFGITPQIGNEFGFILSLTDNDRPGEIDLQSILTHVEARVVEDPTTWGRLVLDPPKPEE